MLGLDLAAGVALVTGNLPLFVFTLAIAVVIGYLLGGAASGNQRRSGDVIRRGSVVKPAFNTDRLSSDAPPRVRSLSNLLRCSSEGKSKDTKRVVIVAKSLPVKISPAAEEGKYTVTWDDSRNWLAAMKMLQKAEVEGQATYSVTWIGCADGFRYKPEEQRAIEAALKEHNCVPVWVPEKVIRRRFFLGFCKGVLWRLFHYVMPQADPDFGKKWEARWDAYTKVNKLIAEAVVKVVSPNVHDAAIWIHGYPALLVPEFVREKLPLAKMGIFVHTPWPTTDVVRCLPERERILHAMLSADIVGFHTYDYARHFLSACRRIAGLDFAAVSGGRLGVKTQSGRTVHVEISHLGVNSQFFSTMAESEGVKSLVAKLRQEHKGRKIVIGVDHLDLVKGTLVKLQAYERFLETHRDMKDEAVLIQVLLPSSNSDEEQKAILESVTQVVDSIKKHHGGECIKVINAGNRENISVEETVAYYRVADAALISTFWDGLNLVPYELTASQDPKRPGVLILSEFMGCSRSLSGALLVNPWSLESVSEKLAMALNMENEARIAHYKNRARYVLGHTTQRWARNFLADLDLAKSLQRDLSFVHVERKEGVMDLVGFQKNFSHLTSASAIPGTKRDTAGSSSQSPTDVFLEKTENKTFVEVLAESKLRVFFLDYDGTLIAEGNLQTVDDDAAAADYTRKVRPSTALLRLLKTLTEDQRNIVFIMSGREKYQLDEWFAGVPELGLAAEKGCFLRWPKRLASLLGTASQLVSDGGDAKIPSSQTPGSPVVRTSVLSFEEQKSPRHKRGPLHGVWESAMGQDTEWKEDVLRLLRAYTERTDGSYIEAKEVSLSWHYDAADPVFGSNQASELHRYIEKIVSPSSIDITQYVYHKILEIKPKGIDKGQTIMYILQQIVNKLGADKTGGKAPFVLAAGDEASDERMFEALKAVANEIKEHRVAANFPNVKLDPGRTISCCVGLRPSAAQYYVYDPKDFVKLLKSIPE